MIDRRSLLGGLALAAPLALGACGRGAEGKAAVLKVGSQKGGTKALMLASGVLAGVPYEVQWSEFGAAQPLIEAISAGAVDLGGVGDAPFLFAYAGGAPIRAVHATKIAGGGSSTAIIVRGASDITSVAGLKGRRIATGRGSVGHYLLLQALAEQGLDAGDVHLSFLPPGDAKAAFASGAVDAWATWGPYVLLAVRNDHARVLVDSRGRMSGYGFLAANAQVIEAKRPLLVDFLGRLSRAERWAATHTAEVAQMLSRETGLESDITRAMAANQRTEPTPIGPEVVAEQTRVLKVFQASGAVTGASDLARAFDASFNGALDS